MRRVVLVCITGVILYSVAICALISLHHAEEREMAIVVRIDGGAFVVTNNLPVNVGQVIAYYQNGSQSVCNIQIWSLKKGESRCIPVTDLLKQKCYITAVCYNGELHMQKEDS